jgi:Zinc finger, C2H2 type
LHLDHHKGEKRHSCSHCGQKFFSYPNMLKHIRRNHLGLRPHKCLICDKSFCEKQELQNHARTHTGEKRPQPKRKRLPLPTPDIQSKEISIGDSHGGKSLQPEKIRKERNNQVVIISDETT